MIKEYIGYLKDNPKGYWFKRKLFGWGWVPAKWQGWAVILAYLLTILYFAWRIDELAEITRNAIVELGLPVVVATCILLFICYKKGERPRWQWGYPER